MLHKNISVFKLKDEMCKKAVNINQQNNYFIVFHILRFWFCAMNTSKKKIIININI